MDTLPSAGAGSGVDGGAGEASSVEAAMTIESSNLRD